MNESMAEGCKKPECYRESSGATIQRCLDRTETFNEVDKEHLKERKEETTMDLEEYMKKIINTTHLSSTTMTKETGKDNLLEREIKGQTESKT